MQIAEVSAGRARVRRERPWPSSLDTSSSSMPEGRVQQVLQADEQADEQAQRAEHAAGHASRHQQTGRRAAGTPGRSGSSSSSPTAPMSRKTRLRANHSTITSTHTRQPSAASTTVRVRARGSQPGSSKGPRALSSGLVVMRLLCSVGGTWVRVSTRGGTRSERSQEPTPRGGFADTGAWDTGADTGTDPTCGRPGHGRRGNRSNSGRALGLERLAALLGLGLAVEQQVRVVGELLDAGVAVLVGVEAQLREPQRPRRELRASRGTTATVSASSSASGTTVLTSPMSSACCASY